MARKMRKGISKVFFAPAVVNKAAPTAAELTAGTDLTPNLAEINGVEFSNQPIDVPDFSSAWDKKVGGTDQAGDPSLTFWEDDTTGVADRTAQSKGTAGFLVFLPWGNVATKPTEVWPVVVTANSRLWSAGNEAAQYRVNYAVTDPMTEGARA